MRQAQVAAWLFACSAFSLSLSAALPSGLLGAVTALKQGLRQLGSDLVVLQGSIEQELPSLVKQLEASNLVLEEEVEYR